MTGRQIDRLVRMANQIAMNLGTGRSPEQAAHLIAEHLRKFWTPDMRRQLANYAVQDGEQLDPALRLALADDPISGET